HPDFVVLCPFASHKSFETWIVPARRAGSFSGCSEKELTQLGDVLRETLRRVRAVTDGADYNLVWRLPPPHSIRNDASFWYLEILPRFGGEAGFELASGMDVITVPPELAAQAMQNGKL